MGMGFLSGVMETPLELVVMVCNFLTILKTTELCTLKGCILWHVSYISIKDISSGSQVPSSANYPLGQFPASRPPPLPPPPSLPSGLGRGVLRSVFRLQKEPVE